MFNFLPFYSKKKMLLAFEWGVMLSEVLYEQKKRPTSEMYKRVEEVITEEFKKKSPTKLSTEIIPILLAIIGK